MTAVPFPFDKLEAFDRTDLAAARRLRRVARNHVRDDAFVAALAELVDDRVECMLRRLAPAVPRAQADGAVGFFVTPSGAPALRTPALVEIEGALAATLVTKALRSRAPRVVLDRSPSPELAGAASAVILTALRRAHTGHALGVSEAGPAFALSRRLCESVRATTAWLTILVGDDAFEAKVSVPLGVEEESPPWTNDALLAMSPVPLALPLVVTTCLVAPSELASLQVGDVFLPPRTGLTARSGWLTGAVTLTAPRSERGMRADLAEDGTLVLRGDLVRCAWDRTAEQSMAVKSDTTLEVLEDAPIVVRVELGAVEMTARAWSELVPGDVITLGRKVGAPAVLRVAGAEVAHGELVTVDGEYGVRVVSKRGGAA